MKIYSCPAEAPFAEPDYANYDSNAEQAREAQHSKDLAAWLKANGWPGERTGQILKEPMADGYALYMYADGTEPNLIHLPYGDAWNSPNVEFLPVEEVHKRLDRQVGLAALFGNGGLTQS